MNKKYDGLLLASGGMDSTVLAYDLANKKQNIVILFIDYGQHCKEKEYATLKRMLPKQFVNNIEIIKIGDIYKYSESRMIKEANLWKDEVKAEDLYLPYRNLLFLSAASAFAQSLGIKIVYSAFINSNHAKEIDCSLKFFTELETLLKEYGSVEIRFPFRDLTKYDVAKKGLELGIAIDKTYSCQVNSKSPCGVCPNCVDRLNAINKLFENPNYDK